MPSMLNGLLRVLSRSSVGAGALLLLAVPGIAADGPPAAAVERLRADLEFLADDDQGGRAPGTEGIERSADRIASCFREIGLEAPEDAPDYFQRFTIKGPPKLGDSQSIAAEVDGVEAIEGRLRRDFMPLSIGGGGELDGVPVVFAGYGITTDPDDDAVSYDDYEGVDAQGKAVIVLRHAPGYERESGPFAGNPRYAAFQHKAVNAFQHGAALILLVNDRAGLGDEEDELLLFTAAGRERYTTAPFVMARRAFVDQLLEAADRPSLEELESKMVGGDLPETASCPLEGLTLDARVAVEQTTIEAKNVVGVLEGAGPNAEETVVVGAHFDHLGNGGSGSLAPFSREVHNGADDNASGTAMMMELARRLAARPDPPPRRVVFLAFSAEERGLLGSRYYVNEQPLYPLNDTVAMFNFDMVGRLNDRGELTIFGAESTPGLSDLVVALGRSQGLTVRPNAQIAGNSDHASFHEKEIPVAFFFTGTHRDYHRPSDDVEAINFEGMARIADTAELLLLDIVRRPERPAFEASEEPEPQPRVAGASASLGTIPDYDDSVEGVRLNGVRAASAAEKAGLQEGDVIVGFGGRPVGTIYDFMEGLSSSKPGDRVAIEVLRDKDRVTLEAVLDAAPASSAHDDD